MEFLVLGPVEVGSEGARRPVGGPKKRSVLALLVANAGRPLSVDRIVEDVYGDDADASTHRSVQTFISSFRNDLGIPIERRADGYLLDADPGSIDAIRFERAVARAEPMIATDPEGAARELREALGLWRGHPYVDVEGHGAFQPEITRLTELRLNALELRIEADLAAGRHGLLLGELESLADQHPLRERFRAQHMLALYRSGRQAEALRSYRRTERYLAGELGLEPSRELRDLELRILQQDDELLSGPARVITQRLAFLVTDIEGSAARWDRHPQDMAEALAAHDRLLTEAVAEAGGTVFKHTGDGVLAAFGDTLSAVGAAEAAQRSLRAHEWGPTGELRVRMGIDVGDVEARAGDFYGPPLNRAARLMAAGHGGQVLVSSAAQAELIENPLPGIQLKTLGEVRLRGLAAPERIAQLVFVGLPAEFPALRLDAAVDLDQGGVALSLPGYELRDRIGEGAYGVVYRAYQPAVGREVAVKMIRRELAAHPFFVRGFEAEARTIARLAHPRIVPLHDFWRDADGAYLVMQLLPGGSLAETLEAGPMDPAAAVLCVRHTAEALAHAHSRGLVHGDLKPSNVLLDGSGNAYLSDFGIATRLLDPAEMPSPLSSSPAYRPPEEAGTGPTQAGDLFALGVLAFETLSGGRLKPGSPIPLLSGERPGLPTDLDPVIARATAIDPGDRYRSVEEFLAAFDTAVADLIEVEPPAPAVARNPYKGLRAFDESDVSDFHGRSDLVASMLTAVARLRFTAVVGPSGCGKSSAVRAGLLPALRRGEITGSDRWYTTVFTPGVAPRDSLIEALESLAATQIDLSTLIGAGDLATAAERVMAEPDTELLIVIDQFEEIFTAVDSEERRASFLELITTAATTPGSRVRFVATLRADFYDRPLTYPNLDRLVRDGLVTVLRPTDDELVEMIIKPALGVGLRWEPGLPHRIATDVRHQPGALPLLQFALTELVERRTSDLLTGTDYDRIGTAIGALSLRAENLYDGLDSGRRYALRQILLRLVTVGEDGSVTRRRVRRSELEGLGIDRALLDDVLADLTTRRLTTTDRDPITRGPTVEVAHEALLAKWQRLGHWIDHQREALLAQRRLGQAVGEWEERGRDEAFLATGERLAQFEAWSVDSDLALGRPEREFLAASRAQADAAKTRRRRTRRRILAGFAAAAAISMVLAGTAVLSRQNAREAADLSRQRELTAEALSAVDVDPERGTLLALEAIEIGGSEALPETISALRTTLHASRVVLRIPGDRFVRYSADGSLLVTGSAEDAAVWDARSGDLIHTLPSPEGRKAWGGCFSPRGDLVAVRYEDAGSEGPLAILWDPTTGAMVRSLEGPELINGGLGLSFSGDGSLLAGGGTGLESATKNGLIFVWDTATGAELYRIDGGSGAAFNPEGTLLAYVADDGDPASPYQVLIVDARTGEELQALETRLGLNIHSTAFSPDGRQLAALSQVPGGLVVWDVETGQESTSRTLDGAPTAMGWAPDGRSIAVSGNEGIPRIYDLGSGNETLALLGHDCAVWSVAYDPSGDRLAGAATLGETLVWDITPAGLGDAAVLRTPYPDVVAFFTAEGTLVALSGEGDASHLALLDPTSGEVLEEIPDQYNAWPVMPLLAPEAGAVVTLNNDFSAALLDLETFGHLTDLPADTFALAVSRDRQWMVLGVIGPEEESVLARVGSWDDSVVLRERVLAYAHFHPDGSLLTIYDGAIGDGWLIEVPGGSVLASFPHPEIASQFSPDGSRLLVLSMEGRLRLLDTEALRTGASPEEAVVTEIEAHDGAIPKASFSHDGSLLVTSGLNDHTIRVWDTESGRPVADLGTAGVPFPAPSFHPDGTHVVATGPDGAILFLTLDADELIEIARNRLTRTFTTEECATYRIEPCPAEPYG